MPRLGNIFDVDGPMSKGCFSDLPVEGMEVSSGPKLCISSADHVFLHALKPTNLDLLGTGKPSSETSFGLCSNTA